VKRFRYLGDSLFLLGSLLYALNRWWIKPHVHSRFMHDHFNDLLLIPCALPPLLLLQRWLRLRTHDGLPSIGEVVLYWTVWSLFLEGIGPRLIPWKSVGDPWDVVAYGVGAIAATLWWQRERWWRRPMTMNFDRLAPHYRWIEGVSAGHKLQSCRTAFLKEIAAPERILIVGEGNGRFLVECRRAWPCARITCVDSSRRMLALARARLLRAGFADAGVDFIHADALDWPAPRAAFDLVVTHFFLDCFPEEQLERVVSLLAEAAAAGAEWLLADFQIPGSGLARWRARLIVGSLYLFFRAATGLPARRLIAPDALLERNGFQLAARRVTDWGLLRSDRWRRASGNYLPNRKLTKVSATAERPISTMAFREPR
jgi:SAM-dependent methyltransferase